MLSVKTINRVEAHREKSGKTYRVSVFSQLPHNLIMGIVKTELDRQKETLHYWTTIKEKARPVSGGWKERHFRERVCESVRELGKLNQSVKAAGYFEGEYQSCRQTDGRVVIFKGDPKKSVRVPNKTLDARGNLGRLEKEATKKTDINYSCNILRWLKMEGDDNSDNLWYIRFTRHWVRIYKIPIRQTYNAFNRFNTHQ